MTSFTLANSFIRTPQVSRTLDRLAEIHADVLRTQSSKGLLIGGPSGCGKTTVIGKYRAAVAANKDVPGRKTAVTLVTMPSRPSKKALASAILDSLGDRFAFSRQHASDFKFDRVEKILGNLGVEMLILDEAQHLVDYQRIDTHDAADWIKDLMNRLPIAVVLVGLERTERLLRINEQLRRRFSANVFFEPFSCFSAEHGEAFATLLHSLAKELPVPTVDLTDEDILARFDHATCGLMDYVIRIMDRAVCLVESEHHEGIDLPILERAFRDEVWSRGPEHRNPFSSRFDFQPLIQPGEPFEGFQSTTRGVHLAAA